MSVSDDFASVEKAMGSRGSWNHEAFAALARIQKQAQERDAEVARWIPVAEQGPPKDGTRVFVLNDRGAFAVEWGDSEGFDWWYCQDGKHDDRPMRGSAPTHWMPIPTLTAEQPESPPFAIKCAICGGGVDADWIGCPNCDKPQAPAPAEECAACAAQRAAYDFANEQYLADMGSLGSQLAAANERAERAERERDEALRHLDCPTIASLPTRRRSDEAWIRRTEQLEADLATARRELAEAVEALRELHAMVWGECPSLLNEDSGGCARLDSEIFAILARKGVQG